MSESHSISRPLPTNEPRTASSEGKLQVQAQLRLQTSGYHELHSVRCDFHEGVLTLRGRVSSFYLKQIAQTMIHRIDGVEEVNNRLEVPE